MYVWLVFSNVHCIGVYVQVSRIFPIFEAKFKSSLACEIDELVLRKRGEFQTWRCPFKVVVSRDFLKFFYLINPTHLGPWQKG